MVILGYRFTKVKGSFRIRFEIGLFFFHGQSFSCSRDNIVGLVNARDFALPDTDSGKFTVRNIMNFCKHRYGSSITPDDSSYDVFNIFKRGFSVWLRSARDETFFFSTWFCFLEQYHFGVVVEYDNTGDKDPKARAVGVVTLEDIIEEMIQEEIVDETDVFSEFKRNEKKRIDICFRFLSRKRSFSSFCF